MGPSQTTASIGQQRLSSSAILPPSPRRRAYLSERHSTASPLRSLAASRRRQRALDTASTRSCPDIIYALYQSKLKLANRSLGGALTGTPLCTSPYRLTERPIHTWAVSAELYQPCAAKMSAPSSLDCLGKLPLRIGSPRPTGCSHHFFPGRFPAQIPLLAIKLHADSQDRGGGREIVFL